MRGGSKGTSVRTRPSGRPRATSARPRLSPALRPRWAEQRSRLDGGIRERGGRRRSTDRGDISRETLDFKWDVGTSRAWCSPCEGVAAAQTTAADHPQLARNTTPRAGATGIGVYAGDQGGACAHSAGARGSELREPQDFAVKRWSGPRRDRGRPDQHPGRHCSSLGFERRTTHVTRITRSAEFPTPPCWAALRHGRTIGSERGRCSWASEPEASFTPAPRHQVTKAGINTRSEAGRLVQLVRSSGAPLVRQNLAVRRSRFLSSFGQDYASYIGNARTGERGVAGPLGDWDADIDPQHRGTQRQVSRSGHGPIADQ